jgi:hypothetical protein
MGILINGCSFYTPLANAQFNNEIQLEQEGFVSKLNQIVYLGDKKVVFEKVGFDRNSMTFIYKGGNIQLPASGIIIAKGIEEDNAHNILEHLDEITTSFGLTVTGNCHSVTVPHDLKLINQTISIQINFNGENNQFDIIFPGEKIELATADVMFDSGGKIINQAAEAKARMIVGIGCTIIQSKGNDEFMIIDKQAKKVLGQSIKSSTIEEMATISDPVSFPRNQLKIKVLPEENTVLISNE